MRFLIFILFTVLFSMVSLVGQGRADSPFPPDRHRELIEEMDFTPPVQDKEEEASEETEAAEEREKSWLEKWLDSWFSEKEEIGPLELPRAIYYFLLVILIGFVGYVVFRALDVVDLGRRMRSPAPDVVRLEEIAEEELDFRETESLLERAEKNGQFKVAVRLQFLALLKRLHESGLIRFERDKVNRVYQLEMNGTPYGPDFRAMTRDFERNWYGEYPLDRLSYRLIAQRFRDFHLQLDRQFVADE